jgi:flagellar protein FlaD
MAGLFKKKKPKEKKPAKAVKKAEEKEVPEVPTEGAPEIPEVSLNDADIEKVLGTALKGLDIDELTAKLDDISRKMDEFQAKIERHDSMIGSLENEISEIRKVNEEMQDNIRRLLDIYEVVSQKINPFIDMGEKKGMPITPDTVIPPEEPENLPPPVFEESAVELPKEKQEKPEVPREYVEEKSKYEKKEPELPKPTEGPILRHIKKDYYTIVLLMRWIEFLFERVKRDKITLLLDYYVDIGWISKEVKSEIMAYARGEVQDVTKYFPEEELEAEIETPAGTIRAPKPRMYKKVEDWRLSAEDHLKSLLFIMKIAGIEVNKDKLNSLEQEIEKFKKSLWEYHGV